MNFCDFWPVRARRKTSERRRDEAVLLFAVCPPGARSNGRLEKTKQPFFRIAVRGPDADGSAMSRLCGRAVQRIKRSKEQQRESFFVDIFRKNPYNDFVGWLRIIKKNKSESVAKY